MTKVAGAAADGFKNLHKVQKRPVWWFLGEMEKEAAGGEQAGPERRFRTDTKIHINKNRR